MALSVLVKQIPNQVSPWWSRQDEFRSIIGTLLARLLIKKGRLLQLQSLASSALTFTCLHDILKSFSCILHKFVMHVTNAQFLDKFNNGWKKFKMADFTSIICPCGCDNLKSFSCILFKFVLHVTNLNSSWTSSIMAEKNSKGPIYWDF